MCIRDSFLLSFASCWGMVLGRHSFFSQTVLCLFSVVFAVGYCHKIESSTAGNEKKNKLEFEHNIPSKFENKPSYLTRLKDDSSTKITMHWCQFWSFPRFWCPLNNLAIEVALFSKGPGQFHSGGTWQMHIRAAWIMTFIQKWTMQYWKCYFASIQIKQKHDRKLPPFFQTSPR